MTKLVFIGQLAKEQLNVIFFYSLVHKYFDIIFVPPMNCKKKKKKRLNFGLIDPI